MSFTFPVRVYWEDTDAGGVVFYANYLKFFERARTEWLRSLGLEQQALRDRTGGMFVVTEAKLRYRQPARLDDLLQVSAVLTQRGLATLAIEQRVTRADVCLCEGAMRIGWVDATRWRPARIPSEIMESLK